MKFLFSLMKRYWVTVLGMALITAVAVMYHRLSRKDDVESALRLAGNNRTELEQVINHYRKNCDSLKLEAALFLIKNLPGHFAKDTSILQSYRPILYMYDSLIKEGLQEDSVDKLIERPWQRLKEQAISRSNFASSNLQPDITTISSEYLILNIEQSFMVWKHSPYSQVVSFADFCEYILPYRRQSGLAIEDWRSEFIKLHFDKLIETHHEPVQVFMDTLLLRYNDYKHTVLNTTMPDFPYLKLSDFKISKRADCGTKCWFNSMLFASIGIPVAIDYVPYWGARNGRHHWNALVLDHKTYPFESFWEENKWRYKQLYNNRSSYEYGVVRLPKVFRYTFSTNQDSPALNPNISLDDIPKLFRNTKFRDVSAQYFETTDIKISLENRPSDSHYAYLCVFNAGRWEPIQWAQIKGNTALFPSMGKDIVYLPAYYKNGKVIPAGDAFLLDQNGSIHEYEPTSMTQNIAIDRKYPMFPIKLEWANTLVGGRFQGSNDANFTNAKDLLSIEKAPNPFLERHKTENDEKFRYVRFLFNAQQVGNLAEIQFLSHHNDSILSLKGSRMSSPRLSTLAEKVLDEKLATYIPPFYQSEQNISSEWIGLDLGIPQEISSIGICPRNDGNNIFPGLNYQLLYWNKTWISLGIQQASQNKLLYENVPKNAIFILKCLDEGREERIFTIEDGKQIWK